MLPYRTQVTEILQTEKFKVCSFLGRFRRVFLDRTVFFGVNMQADEGDERDQDGEDHVQDEHIVVLR